MCSVRDTDALADAADMNFVLHASWAPQQTRDMTVLAEPELTLVDSGLPCDTFNVICRTRLTANQAPQRIRDAMAFFKRVGRPFSWWVGPGDQPANLDDILVDAGLLRAETELAMAVDLSDLETQELTPAGLEIHRVQTPAALHDFADIVAANWRPPDPDVQRFYSAVTPALLAPASPQWLYVGYLMNQPVATSEGVVGGGVVGLYNICTREEYRRRGIGTALMLRPLIDALNCGLRTGVLQAAVDGVRLYTRFGFEKFGDITEYQLPVQLTNPVSNVA